MGGTKSKFEETDWDLADGKLGQCEETIDGMPPTSEFGVYNLTKKAMNQREFEVTDSNKNLLYTTRIVPGTLAWFDVLDGKGLEEYVLRVQVDYTRRYWIIYRYGIPAFAGQLADIMATGKLANDRVKAIQQYHKAHHPEAVEPSNGRTATPFLFRKCCVTISWSRYIAVALHYGPPTLEILQKYSDKKNSQNRNHSNSNKKELANDSLGGYTSQSTSSSNTASNKPTGQCTSAADDDSDDDDLFNAANKITERMASRRNLQDALDEEDDADRVQQKEKEVNAAKEDKLSLGKVAQQKQSPDTQQQLETDIEEPASNWCGTTQQFFYYDDTTNKRNTNTRCDDKKDTPNNNKSSGTPGWAEKMKERAMESMNDIKQMHKTSGEINKSITDHDPLEGMLHLENKPLLLCQEIYDKIAGNHQTSRITKKDAITFFRQDEAQHRKDAGEDETDFTEEDDPFLLDQISMLETHRMEIKSSSVPTPQKANKPSSLNVNTSFKNSPADFKARNSFNGGEDSTKSRSSSMISYFRSNSDITPTAGDQAQQRLQSTGIAAANLSKFRSLSKEYFSRMSSRTGIGNSTPTNEVGIPNIMKENDGKISLQQKATDDNIEVKTNCITGTFNDESGGIIEEKKVDANDAEILHATDYDKEVQTDGAVRIENIVQDDTETQTDGSANFDDDDEDDNNDEQPLVGYWKWENTMRVHQMKMHVGKGADLALHVVMAIIVNQVRYERNAIAMTV